MSKGGGESRKGTGQVIQGLVSLGEDLDFYPREVVAPRAVGKGKLTQVLAGAPWWLLWAAVGAPVREAGLVQASHDVGPGGGKREGRSEWTLDTF